jgi:hypothetical protein
MLPLQFHTSLEHVPAQWTPPPHEPSNRWHPPYAQASTIRPVLSRLYPMLFGWFVPLQVRRKLGGGGCVAALMSFAGASPSSDELSTGFRSVTSAGSSVRSATSSDSISSDSSPISSGPIAHPGCASRAGPKDISIAIRLATPWFDFRAMTLASTILSDNVGLLRVANP